MCEKMCVVCAVEVSVNFVIRHIRDVAVLFFLTYDLLLFVFFLASVISLVFVTKIGCFCLFC